MDHQKDFADLCVLLNARGVEFLIVGGYAVAFHGAPRFTGDLDILIQPSHNRVVGLIEALSEFGFPTANLSAAYVIEQRKILELGRIPVQIHIMTSISGVTWDEAWAARERGHYGNVPVFFLGREELIRNKRSAGRAKDMADVEALDQRKQP